MSILPSPRESHHDEQSREETIDPVGLGAYNKTPHGRDEKQYQNHSEEAVESVHEVSASTSRDEDEIASSIEDVDPRDVESSISEPPYTVFTSSQKRFIALLAACAGFFSAVCSHALRNLHLSLTLPGLCKHILPSPQFTD